MVDFLGWHIGRQERADQEVQVVDQSGNVDNTTPQTAVTQTAAVVFGVGLYSRGFAAATIDPPVMKPWDLAGYARDMLLRGEWVAYLVVEGFGMSVARASSAVVRGGYRPRSWRYDLTLPAPSDPSPPIYGVPYDGVAHVRINTASSAPWRGLSPLQEAGVSADLLRFIEDGLCEEETMPRTAVLNYGQSVQSHTQLRADLAEGGVVLLEQGPAGWQQRQTPQSSNIHQVHIGPEPDANEVSLRSSVSQDILSAMGVPSGLYAAREGSVSREAYRQWHASGLEPMGEALRKELEDKMEIPISISFDKLAAADIAGRARGLKGLVEAGVEHEDAGRVVGFSGLRFAPPPPPSPVEEPPLGTPARNQSA